MIAAWHGARESGGESRRQQQGEHDGSHSESQQPAKPRCQSQHLLRTEQTFLKQTLLARQATEHEASSLDSQTRPCPSAVVGAPTAS